VYHAASPALGADACLPIEKLNEAVTIFDNDLPNVGMIWRFDFLVEKLELADEKLESCCTSCSAFDELAILDELFYDLRRSAGRSSNELGQDAKQRSG